MIDAELDYTATTVVTGLAASSRYDFTVELENQTEISRKFNKQHPLRGSFRTWPRADKPLAIGESVSFAFASCILPVVGQGALTVPNRVVEENPSAFLLLGDTIYIDEPRDRCFSRECFRNKYKVLINDPSIRNLRSSIPVVSMYDDHGKYLFISVYVLFLHLFIVC